MPSFTREQLRTFTTNSADFTAVAHTFTLLNNNSTTAGFSMEGEGKKEIFESGSITNLLNCSLVSGTQNTAFLIGGEGSVTGFSKTSGSLKTERNALLKTLVGTISGSRKYLTATSLKEAFTDVSASAGTYTNITSSNFNLTASITLDTTESISTISNLTGESASLDIGDIIIFPSKSLGATNDKGRNAKFTLTENTFTYTGVTASVADVTASLFLIESTSLGAITITGQGSEFVNGDTITFPSESFGATDANGEDAVFTLKISDILSNGTASFIFTPTSTIAQEDILMLAPNALVYNVKDATASGSYFGVDLDIST